MAAPRKAKFQKRQALRIYLDEKKKWKGKPLYRALVERFLRSKAPGATVFRAVEGFGASAHLREARILELSEDLPLVVELIGPSRTLGRCLKEVREMLPPHCLVTLQEVRVVEP